MNRKAFYAFFVLIVSFSYAGIAYSQDSLEVKGEVYSSKEDFVRDFVCELINRDSMTAEEIRKYVHFEAERGAAYKKYGPGEKLNYHSLNPGKVRSLVFDYLKDCECVVGLKKRYHFRVFRKSNLDYIVNHDSLRNPIEIDLATVPRVTVDNFSCSNCDLRRHTSIRD